MCGAILPLPQYAFMVYAQLKHRDNFTLLYPYLSQSCIQAIVLTTITSGLSGTGCLLVHHTALCTYSKK
jgi:hypothetical protein